MQCVIEALIVVMVKVRCLLFRIMASYEFQLFLLMLWDVKLTTHPCLVLRSRMRGAIPPLPTPLMAWCSDKEKAQGQLYLYL